MGIVVITLTRAFISTRFTNALEDNPRADNLEMFSNLVRYFYVIVGLILKVKDTAALNAVQMVMVCYLWIETLCTAKHFDNIHNADSSEGQ